MQRRPRLHPAQARSVVRKYQVSTHPQSFHCRSRPPLAEQHRLLPIPFSPLTVCVRVGSSLQLIDPSTLQIADIPSTIYWRTPFDAVARSYDLVEFLVLDIEPSGPTHGKHLLADAQVTLNSSLQGGSTTTTTGKRSQMDMDNDNEGRTDAVYHTRTHLGRILHPGDTAMGYFLARANVNNAEYEALARENQLPDVVLIKKSYPVRRKKHQHKHREWKLKSMAKEAEDDVTEGVGRGALGRRGGVDQERVERDYEHFLRDLEEDPELRATVNLYKNTAGSATGDVKMGEQGSKKKSAAARRKAQKGGDATMMDVEDLDENAAMVDTEAATTDDDEGDEEEADFPRINPDELLDAMDELTIKDKNEA